MMMIFDVSTAPQGKVRFKDILKHFDDRMYLHPIFRRRLATVPFGLDRPYWVADKDIDVEYHIRHIALPKPGDWRQLMIQVARLPPRSSRLQEAASGMNRVASTSYRPGVDRLRRPSGHGKAAGGLVRLVVRHSAPF